MRGNSIVVTTTEIELNPKNKSSLHDIDGPQCQKANSIPQRIRNAIKYGLNPHIPVLSKAILNYISLKVDQLLLNCI